MGKLDANFVAHEVAFVVLGNTLFCCLATFKFLKRFQTWSLWKVGDRTHHKAVANSTRQ